MKRLGESIYGNLMKEAENTKNHIRNRKHKVNKYMINYIQDKINNVYQICISIDLPSNSFVSLYFTEGDNINRLIIYADGNFRKDFNNSDELSTYENPENIKSLFDKLFRIKNYVFPQTILTTYPKHIRFYYAHHFVAI